MLIFLLVGLFCLLLVVGFFVTGGESPLAFALMSMVVLGAVAFLLFIAGGAWVLITSN
jgi:hypothetical protein